jgi:hypothetical protein
MIPTEWYAQRPGVVRVSASTHFDGAEVKGIDGACRLTSHPGTNLRVPDGVNGLGPLMEQFANKNRPSKRSREGLFSREIVALCE